MQSIFPGIDAAPNLHPLVVHFPIALWLAALAFWLAGTLRRRDDLLGAGRWLLWLGAAGGALAVGTGYWATEKMGHDTPGHDLVHVHRDFMLVAAVAAAATAVAAFVLRRRTDRLTRWSLVAALGVVSGVTLLGADRGALLVFGYGVGTAHLAPPPSHPHAHGEHGEHGHAGGGDHQASGEQHEGHDHGAHGHEPAAPGSAAADLAASKATASAPTTAPSKAPSAVPANPQRAVPAPPTAAPHGHARGDGHAHGHAHDE